MTTKRNVMIKILSSRTEITKSLFEDEEIEEDLFEDAEASDMEMPEPIELWMEGRLVVSDLRAELVYEESELSGMEGSISTIGFDLKTPGLVSMLRSGLVNTALIFEEHTRHICMYHTPFSEFEVCVHSLRVSNRLLEDGILELDYLIEIHGAQTERCKMTVSVKEIEEIL